MLISKRRQLRSIFLLSILLIFSEYSIVSSQFAQKITTDPFDEFNEFYLQYYYSRSGIFIDGDIIGGYWLHQNMTTLIEQNISVTDITGFRLTLSKLTGSWWNCDVNMTMLNDSYTGSIFYNRGKNSWHLTQDSDNPLYIPFFLLKNCKSDFSINFCTNSREFDIEKINGITSCQETIYVNVDHEFSDTNDYNIFDVSFTDSKDNPRWLVYEGKTHVMLKGGFYTGGISKFCEWAFDDISNMSWNPGFDLFETNIVFNEERDDSLNFNNLDLGLVIAGLFLLGSTTVYLIKRKKSSVKTEDIDHTVHQENPNLVVK
ncbi:hypothetical protein [Candidatus Lokiarchaeum ossiferum]|uniref:hypothetical protein n=1 Tax=Candidatus Lokiarchaeum ossiferum TaxID=2951803 RepID=UPI00352FA8EB